MPPQVGVGVAAFIFSEDLKSILMIERKGSHGADTWAVPGGWLEKRETLLQAAERETYEEVGLRVKAIQNLGFTEDWFIEEDVYDVCHMIICRYESGEVSIMEPDKIAGFEWTDCSNLRSKGTLFLPLHQFVESGDFDIMVEVVQKVGIDDD